MREQVRRMGRPTPLVMASMGLPHNARTAGQTRKMRIEGLVLVGSLQPIPDYAVLGFVHLSYYVYRRRRLKTRPSGG